MELFSQFWHPFGLKIWQPWSVRGQGRDEPFKQKLKVTEGQTEIHREIGEDAKRIIKTRRQNKEGFL